MHHRVWMIPKVVYYTRPTATRKGEKIRFRVLVVQAVPNNIFLRSVYGWTAHPNRNDRAGDKREGRFKLWCDPPLGSSLCRPYDSVSYVTANGNAIEKCGKLLLLEYSLWQGKSSTFVANLREATWDR